MFEKIQCSLIILYSWEMRELKEKPFNYYSQKPFEKSQHDTKINW